MTNFVLQVQFITMVFGIVACLFNTYLVCILSDVVENYLSQSIHYVVDCIAP